MVDLHGESAVITGATTAAALVESGGDSARFLAELQETLQRHA